LLILGKALLS